MSASATARADIWVLDRQASAVHFAFDRLGLSRPRGRFTDIEGRLEFSPTDPEGGSVDITIRAAAISTGVAEWDQVLRSADFLSVQRFPQIRFRSTGVTKTGERTGDVSGELTMMGVTQPVTLKVRWNFTGEYPLSAVNPIYQGRWVSGFSATTRIERSQWGLKRGIPLLSDDVEIEIEAEFLKAD